MQGFGFGIGYLGLARGLWFSSAKGTETAWLSRFLGADRFWEEFGGLEEGLRLGGGGGVERLGGLGA